MELMQPSGGWSGSICTPINPNGMKSTRLFSLLSLFALASFSTIWSQECNPISFSIQNTSNTIENLTIAYDLIGNSGNGDLFSTGSWSVNAAEAAWVEFCLPAGCYALFISGESVNPESIAMELWQSDYVQMVEFDSQEGGWIFNFCVENAPVFDCPDFIDYAAGEGCAWAFEIGSFQEGENVVWNFGDGQEPVEGGHFIEHEFAQSGVYTVSAFFTDYDCPMGVELYVVIEVTGCGEVEPECEIELVVETEDGMWYTFSAPGFGEWATYHWYVNGQVVDGADDAVFEAGFDFNPYWAVCVTVVTDACPEGAEACFYNMGTEACPDEVLVDNSGCYYVFSLGEQENVEVHWSVDGEWVEWSANVFDYTFETPGEHVIAATYWSFDCPGMEYEIVINAEGCGNSDCTIEAVAYPLECNEFLVEALNFPEGAQLYWTLDGEPYEVNTAEFFYTSADEDCHVFSVAYETPDCPQGVSDEVEVCPDCGGIDCDVTIVWEALADGIYLFSAVNADGQLWGGTVNWWTTGQNVGTGNPFAWTWDNEESSVESMCIGFSEWENCGGGETCVELETEPMECEEVQFVLNAEWITEIAWAFEILIEADIEGWEIEGWSLDLDWAGTGSVSDTLSFCVPPACFEVLSNFELPFLDLESFVVFALLNGGDPEVLIDILAEEFNDFGLLPDCLGISGVDDLDRFTAPASVWPNPARGEVNWTLPIGDFSGEMQVHSLDGKLMFQAGCQASSGTIECHDWAAGLYTITWVEKGMPAFRSLVLVAD